MREPLDDFGGVVTTPNCLWQKVDLYHCHNNIFSILPDGVPLRIQRIVQSVKSRSVKIRFFKQNRFHMIVVFQFTLHLLANASSVFTRLVCCPAFLLFHTPCHCLWNVAGPVTIFIPIPARGIASPCLSMRS